MYDDLKTLFRSHPQHLISAAGSFTYDDPLTGKTIHSSQIKHKLKAFERISDLEKLLPDSRHFDPETYLKILHD